MQYFAKTNTADPRIGFISVGEYLTEKQVEALGAEKVAELVARGVLAASGEKPTDAVSPDDAAPAEQEIEAPEARDDEETEPDDEELPELAMTEDIVNDQPEAPVAKKGGRRKTK